MDKNNRKFHQRQTVSTDSVAVVVAVVVVVVVVIVDDDDVDPAVMSRRYKHYYRRPNSVACEYQSRRQNRTEHIFIDIKLMPLTGSV